MRIFRLGSLGPVDGMRVTPSFVPAMREHEIPTSEVLSDILGSVRQALGAGEGLVISEAGLYYVPLAEKREALVLLYAGEPMPRHLMPRACVIEGNLDAWIGRFFLHKHSIMPSLELSRGQALQLAVCLLDFLGLWFAEAHELHGQRVLVLPPTDS